MSAFTSYLGPQIERFLVHKRALGRGYHREEAFLREIDRFASRGHDGFLSEQLVRIYFSSFTPAARPNRLTLIRQLARSLAFEESTFIPSFGLFHGETMTSCSTLALRDCESVMVRRTYLVPGSRNVNDIWTPVPSSELSASSVQL